MSKPKFKVGDKVICIDDLNKKYTLLKFRQEYTIDYVYVCNCGSPSYDIGLMSLAPPNRTVIVECECGKDIPGKNIDWCKESRFEKPTSTSVENEESEFIQMEFTVKELVKQPISQN